MKLTKKVVLNICASCLYWQNPAMQRGFEELGGNCGGTSDAAVQYVYHKAQYGNIKLQAGVFFIDKINQDDPEKKQV